MQLGTKPITVDFKARDVADGKFGIKFSITETEEAVNITGSVSAANGSADRIAKATENILDRAITELMSISEGRSKLSGAFDDVPGTVSGLIGSFVSRGGDLVTIAGNLFKQATASGG